MKIVENTVWRELRESIFDEIWVEMEDMLASHVYWGTSCELIDTLSEHLWGAVDHTELLMRD